MVHPVKKKAWFFGDRVKIIAAVDGCKIGDAGKILHPWPLPDVKVSKYYTIRLDNGRLRIVRVEEIVRI